MCKGDRIVQKRDESGHVAADYAYGLYVDEVLQVRRGGQAYHLLHDDQYTALGLVDAQTGREVERYSYGPFGAPTVHLANAPSPALAGSAYGNRFLFTGREWDAQLGLYDYRTRYYDPRQGRFLSRDTIGLWGDAANLGNPYTYCANNPWSRLDPYGEVIESGWDVFSAGVGLLSLGYNLWNGNWGDAGLDTLGVAADVGATLVPGLPGGAGVGIKAGRAAETVRTLQKADQVVTAGQGAAAAIDTGTAIVEGDTKSALMNAGAALLQTGHYSSRLIPGNRGEEIVSLSNQLDLEPVITIGKSADAITINPRLVARSEAWKAYKARGGQESAQRWIKLTQRHYGGVSGGYSSGFASWCRSVTSVHGNSRLSQKTAYLYRLEDMEGNLLKWGVTQDLGGRYSQDFLLDKNLVEVTSGRRAEILDLERSLAETNPGPLNLEPWAGKATP